jgi:Protein of unknown function (DUF4229)
VKIFVLYTLARVGLFAASYGVVWLLVGHWLPWDAVSALSTAIVAMLISSLVALTVLRGMRDRLAISVAERAQRASAAFEARRAAEDPAAEGTPGAGDATTRRAPASGDGGDE